MKTLKYPNHPALENSIKAIDTAFLLGFQTEHTVFPILREDGEITIPETDEELLSLFTLQKPCADPDYREAVPYAEGTVTDMDPRTARGLECMFKAGIFLKDTNKDTLPDEVNVKFILPEEMDLHMLSAACSLAFRFGMETNGFTGSLIADDDYTGPSVRFAYDDENAIRLNGQDILVSGHGEELEEMMNRFCSEFPYVNAVQTWQDTCIAMTKDLSLEQRDGQMAMVNVLLSEGKKELTLYASPSLSDQSKKQYPSVNFEGYKDGTAVYDQTFECSWEKDDFLDLFRNDVLPLLHSGDQVSISAALSEDREVREEVMEQMQEMLEEQNCTLNEMQVVNAYKQGFSWIREYVIPAVQKLQKDRDHGEVIIAFRPFLPPNQTEWIDENGATPSYHNTSNDNPDHWYDLPIRYLQELYPIEDILKEQLHLNRNQIRFVLYEGEEDLTYTFNYREQNTSVYSTQYKAYCSERPYLDLYPGMGKVHPSTGYLSVRVNGVLVYSQTVPTDLENVWDLYQSEVLPSVLQFCEEKHGVLTAEKQPFFRELKLDVYISECEEKLSSREDLISPADALHEDMHFAGSDFFKQYGTVHHTGMLDAPGLICPVIHNVKGKPVLHAVLYEQKKSRPCITQNDTVLAESTSHTEKTVYVSGISYRNHQMCIELHTEGMSDAFMNCYAEKIRNGTAEINELTGAYDLLHFTQTETDAVLLKKEIIKDLEITDLSFPENEVIGYDRYIQIMEQMKRVKGVEVWKSAVSYDGRIQYSMWLKPECEGYLSLTKYLAGRMCEHINARHHANEVSSTNACFILLKKLLTDEKYKDLREQMCIVMTPVENVDGTALHDELQKEHENHKFHAARFDALGKEFFHDSFNPSTIHTEALGFGHLYTAFLPDVCTDNHGVPSHEWEQQFSGYTSPSYKGFWLPRSLLYGYFWYVDDEAYESNRLCAKEMEKAIADAMELHPEMTALNKEWMHQFETFAHQWMPNLFPADYYRGMINYWIRHKPVSTNRYPACRWPWITTVSYTSEAADETAQGEYLKLCAEAHVMHDLAVIDLLRNAQYVWNCSLKNNEKGLHGEYLRRRPFIIANTD